MAVRESSWIYILNEKVRCELYLRWILKLQLVRGCEGLKLLLKFIRVGFIELQIQPWYSCVSCVVEPGLRALRSQCFTHNLFLPFILPICEVLLRWYHAQSIFTVRISEILRFLWVNVCKLPAWWRPSIRHQLVTVTVVHLLLHPALGHAVSVEMGLTVRHVSWIFCVPWEQVFVFQTITLDTGYDAVWFLLTFGSSLRFNGL